VAYVLGHADIEVIVCEDQEQTDKVLEAHRPAAAPAQDRGHRDQGPGELSTRSARAHRTFAEVVQAGAEVQARDGTALIDAALAAPGAGRHRR
jgi:long-chain acyl-CoA synthetase